MRFGGDRYSNNISNQEDLARHVSVVKRNKDLGKMAKSARVVEIFFLDSHGYLLKYGSLMCSIDLQRDK